MVIYRAYDFGAQWLARQFSQSTSREIATFIATHVSSVCESNRRVVIISALRNSFVHIVVIYTIILIKSVWRRSQTAGRNYCTIVSGDVSNCSYRLTVHHLTSSRLS